jgi:type VI secretion system secreted protein VgrG
MTTLYELEADFLPAGAEVISFEGSEALSTPYRFHILLVVPLADGLSLDLDGATGKTARLVIHHETSRGPRHGYSGTVAALELVEDLARYSLLRLHLVPKAWRLGLGEHSRVFVDKALPDILRETLEDGGLTLADYDLRLTGEYKALPHVCQLRESRLAFITRWLERVGAYYFFEQGDEQEKLVVTDSRSSHWSARDEPVRFVPQHARDTSAGEALRSFRWKSEGLPRKVAVADYYPLHPQLSVTGTADVAPDGAGGDVHLFKVNVEKPGDAQRYAATRAQERLSGGTTCRAHGLVFGLMPGLTFDLAEHPRDDLNRTYLVTEIRHRGLEPRWYGAGLGIEAHRHVDDAGERYRCELEAVEASRHWLPPSTTRWPRIAGTVRARVDGEADSEFAQLDEHGRYLVRLMLDESGLPDGKASTRVRMAQPHAGNPEGMHFPLRKGTEVQVAFLRGDPDQPVIAGVVPDVTTASPVVAGNRSQNVIQTGGQSRVEIEDQQGSEYIDVSTPPEKTFLHLGAKAGLGSHNYVFSTSGDMSMHTGGNRDLEVGGKLTETVGGNVNESYHAAQTTTVDGKLTETIDGGATQTIHAGSTQTIDGGVKQTISGGEVRNVTGGQKETIDGGRTQTITGTSTETIVGDLSQTITGAASITSPVGHQVAAAGGFTLDSPASITMIANGGFNLLAPGGQRRLDDDFTQLGGEYKVFSKNQLVIVGHRIDLRGLYVEIVGLKLDLYGLKQTTGATIHQTAAFYLGTDGWGATTHVFSQLQAGFTLFGG